MKISRSLQVAVLAALITFLTGVTAQDDVDIPIITFPTRPEPTTTESTEIKTPKYVLTYPSVIRSSDTFAFYLTLFESDDYELPVDFEATLKINDRLIASQPFYQDSYGLQEHVFGFVNLWEFVTEEYPSISVSIKFLSEGLGSSEELVSNEQLRKDNFVFIQTDKAIYKPGQEVKIVAIVLKPNLQPVSGSTISIRITDSQGNVMQALDNVVLNYFGIVEFGLTLSAFTSLGDWVIEVIGFPGIQKTQKTFSVQFYVLPNIELSVGVSNGYLVYSKNEEAYRGSVSAKYTFGKSATGRAVVTVSSVGYCNWEYDQFGSKLPRVTYTVDLKGDDSASDGVFYLKGLNELLNPSATMGLLIDLRCSLILTATFSETATGKVYKAEPFSFTIHRYPYSLETHPSNPTNVKAGLPFTVRYQVKRPDGSALDDATGIKVAAETYIWTTDQPRDYRVECYAVEDNDGKPLTQPNNKYTLEADSDGIVTVTIAKPPTSFESILFKLKLVDYSSVQLCDSHYPENTKSGKAIALTVDRPIPSPMPKVGDTITFKAQVTFGTKWIYFILAVDGQAVVYERLEKPISRKGGVTTFTKEVTLTQKMAPRVTAVVWTIEPEKSEILADWAQVDLDGLVQQEVTASFEPATVSPGSETTLSVSTSDHNSALMLLAVDKRVRLLKSGNQILIADVLNAIAGQGDFSFQPMPFIKRIGPAIGGFVSRCEWLRGFPCFPYPGGGSDVNTIFSNAKMVIFSNLETGGNNFPVDYYRVLPEAADAKMVITQTSTAVRSNFPETWIWLLTASDDEGQFVKTMKAPDTITTYELNAFAIGLDKGFGGVLSLAQLTIFKSFFVALDVKVPIIKRNEQVQFTILIFNYRSTAVMATVQLLESCDFEVLTTAPGEEEETYQSTTFIADGIEIAPNGVASVPVWIRPVTVGNIVFELSGYPDEDPAMSDAIQTSIEVEAEGRVFYANKAVLVQLPEADSDFSKTIEVNNLFGPRAEAIVPDSKIFKVEAIGSPLGAALANLDRFVYQPSGCGEQTMIILAPNVYIYTYLKAVGALTTQLDVTIKTYAQDGYDNELKYRRADGGFSAFGESDPNSSTWLTCFVAQVFTAASQVLGTIVDFEIMNSAFAYIESQRQLNGAYIEKGRVIHVDMQGGARGDVNLAAYIYLTLAESGRVANESTRELLEAAATDPANSDAYQLALLSYAFSLNMHPEDFDVSQTALSRLLTLKSTLGSDLIFWKTPDTPQVVDEYTKCGQSAIETAGYAVLALIKHNDLNNAVSVARWLMTQRNSLGGFSSTQDTVVGLKALSAISEKLTAAGEDIKIDVACNYGDDETPRVMTKSFEINTSNSFILQSADLPRERQALESVLVDAYGVGVAMVQLAARYNLYKYDSGHFSLETSVVSGNIDTEIVIETCLNSLHSDVRGMVLLEIDVVTGMKADLEATIIENKEGDKFVEPLSRIELGVRKIIFYFTELPTDGVFVCVKSVFARAFPAKDYDPPLATAYSYYAIETYFLATSFSLE